MKQNKKTLFIIAAVVVVVLIIILVARGGGNDGESRRANRSDDATEQQPTDAVGKAILAGRASFQAEIGQIQVTGERPQLADESLDAQVVEAIDNTLATLESSVDPEVSAVTFSSQEFTSGEFASVVITYDQPALGADVLVFQEGQGQVVLGDILTGDYQTRISGYVRDQLSRRFPNATASLDQIVTAEAFEQSFRVADNGIVIIVPLENLNGSSGVHEVLVPLSVLEAFQAE